MKKKIIAFSFVAWAIAAISSPRPAKAVIALPGLEDVTEVVVLNKWKNNISYVCGYYLPYQQLMAIPGVGRTWVATDTIYPFFSLLGPRIATAITTCEENGEIIYLYGIGDCAC